jgi:hypothetical protein
MYVLFVDAKSVAIIFLTAGHADVHLVALPKCEGSCGHCGFERSLFAGRTRTSQELLRFKGGQRVVRTVSTPLGKAAANSDALS